VSTPEGDALVSGEGDSGPDVEIGLREITEETVFRICSLSATLSERQQRMVKPNAVSIAQAHFSDHAWFRAIYAGETPVGFVMLHVDPTRHEYHLWRLMVARPHQRKGYGKRAMEHVVEYVKSQPGAAELLTSYEPIDDGPGGFYRQLGFEPTGEMDEGQVVARLAL
jgi:diamine N-acetyltransferase